MNQYKTQLERLLSAIKIDVTRMKAVFAMKVAGNAKAKSKGQRAGTTASGEGV
jgi:hypothetical protein